MDGDAGIRAMNITKPVQSAYGVDVKLIVLFTRVCTKNTQFSNKQGNIKYEQR